MNVKLLTHALRVIRVCQDYVTCWSRLINPRIKLLAAVWLATAGLPEEEQASDGTSLQNCRDLDSAACAQRSWLTGGAQ